jgi:hypothetical protein
MNKPGAGIRSKPEITGCVPDILLLQRGTLFREMMSARVNKFIGWTGF